MKKRYSEEQIVQALKKVDAGTSAKELCRTMGISEQTYYLWRRKFGGMEKSQVIELKHLQEENNRLKRIVADQALDIQALKYINTKKF
jgi:putative transposase